MLNMLSIGEDIHFIYIYIYTYYIYNKKKAINSPV